MPFGQAYQSTLSEKPQGTSIFMRLSPNTTVILRILDQQELAYKAVAMQVVSNGAKTWRLIPVREVHPEIQRAAKNPELGIRISWRYMMNVLDRTPVNDAGELITTGVVLPTSRRVNTVKILDVGRSMMDQFVSIASSARQVVNGEAVPIPIQKFDLTITTRGQGRNVMRTVIPDLTPTGTEPTPDSVLEQRYNLASYVLFVDPADQLRLLRGGDYTEVVKPKAIANSDGSVDDLF